MQNYFFSTNKSGSRLNYSDKNYNAIKAKPYNKNTDLISDSRKYQQEREEKKLINKIIENPDDMIKLGEEDIHSALKNTGNLPELDLKKIIEKNLTIEETKQEINFKILKKLNLCLNKSLIEISKFGAKNSPEVFKDFEKFWVCLAEEIITRRDSLSNSQIAEIVSSFGKCNLTDNIKLFEDLEELIVDTPVPFLVIFVI
jgi:hypothetical protein